VAQEKKLKLGKGVAFVKSRLIRLSQGDGTWEADFRALPKQIMQIETGYLGMVVTQPDGYLLADLSVQGRPSVNDLATLLAHAMCRPMSGNGHRPQRILLRGHRQWKELFPVLKELGIETSVERNLPGIDEAFQDYLRLVRDDQRAGTVPPPPEQAQVESMFPAIARYVRGYGYIEIGDQESFGFVVRALGYGGLEFEDDTSETLAEAMAVLESGLVQWFEEQSVEIDGP
jgi:hypothetical protein